MPSNYVLLGKVTLNANTASVTFSSLPTTGYTDLKLVYSTRVSAGANPAHTDYIKFNNSSANFKYRNLQGAGSGTPSTNTDTDGIVSLNNGPGATASTFSSAELYIFNYRSSAYKSFTVDSITENNATTAYIQPLAGLWSNVSPITEINIDPDSGNYVAGTEFCLYGLAAVGTTPAISPFATGGDIVTSDGTYWYHAFLSSGTFTTAKALSVDCLVVAGGGGGSTLGAGGGGAGGLVALTGQSLSSNTSYSAIVGAGGVGAQDSRNGSDSKFASLTTAVGGGAGAYAMTQGGAGGSGGGGGGGYGVAAGGAGGIGEAGQGNNGGSGTTGTGSPSGASNASGGGGGAGAVGANGVSGGASGNGGVGTTTYSSWGLVTATGQNSGGTVYYAGGGGGGRGGSASAVGSGGLGGGGAGGYNATATSGTANTGGGGGGGGNTSGGTSFDGGAGGSGVIIVRYPIA